MNTKVDEGKLISGKEALIALANGEGVEYMGNTNTWYSLNKETSAWTITEVLNPVDMNKGTNFKFRLKPRTISINGIEIPAPFKPKGCEKFWIISDDYMSGYTSSDLIRGYSFGAWRTEEEIKQVVAALRQVFGGSHE